MCSTALCRRVLVFLAAVATMLTATAATTNSSPRSSRIPGDHRRFPGYFSVAPLALSASSWKGVAAGQTPATESYAAYEPPPHAALPPLMAQVANYNDTPFRAADGSGVLDHDSVRRLAREMFLHAWNGYLDHAYPHDDLAPLSCTGITSQGDYYLTLIDGADTLAVMGETAAFEHAVDLIARIRNFDMNLNVSVFETHIRLVGGLISIHYFTQSLLNGRHSARILGLAVDLADRLMIAFDTPTGIPYGTVNLRHGVPTNETTLVCTACATTMSLEFGYLSILSKNSSYYKAAKKAVTAIWQRRSRINLMGMTICCVTGRWHDASTSIAGANDSFFEYLWKAWLAFGDPEMFYMFNSAYASVERHAVSHGWHNVIDMHSGRIIYPVFSSLQCFWPGMQVAMGEHIYAAANLLAYAGLFAEFPLLPESLNLLTRSLTMSRGNPLRPEFLESVYFMYRAVDDPGLAELAFDAAKRYVTMCATACGFAGIQDIYGMHRKNHMESFFLAETLKYLYLIFDKQNVLNTDPWIFSTEAHPFPHLPDVGGDEMALALGAYDDDNDSEFAPAQQAADNEQVGQQENETGTRRQIWSVQFAAPVPIDANATENGRSTLYRFDTGHCDAREAKSVRSWLSMAPAGTGFDWMRTARAPVCPAAEEYYSPSIRSILLQSS